MKIQCLEEERDRLLNKLQQIERTESGIVSSTRKMSLEQESSYPEAAFSISLADHNRELEIQLQNEKISNQQLQQRLEQVLFQNNGDVFQDLILTLQKHQHIFELVNQKSLFDDIILVYLTLI